MLAVIHPHDPLHQSIYIDAGPARGDASKSRKRRGCKEYRQLCARARNAAFVFDRRGYDNIQSFHLDKPFNEVVRLMSNYVDRVNRRAVGYNTLSMNCNSFVFTFLRNWLGIRDIEPAPFDPGQDIYPVGWNKDVPGV